MIRFCPPLIISSEEVDVAAVEKVETAVGKNDFLPLTLQFLSDFYQLFQRLNLLSHHITRLSGAYPVLIII